VPAPLLEAWNRSAGADNFVLSLRARTLQYFFLKKKIPGGWTQKISPTLICFTLHFNNPTFA
jgi:hypothetical protein